jgi:hypothetical protein
MSASQCPRAGVRYPHFLINTEGNPIEREQRRAPHMLACMRRPGSIDAVVQNAPLDLPPILPKDLMVWSRHRSFRGTAVVRGYGAVALLVRRTGVAARLSVCRVMAAFACSEHPGLLERGAAAAFCRAFSWCSNGQEGLNGTSGM